MKKIFASVLLLIFFVQEGAAQAKPVRAKAIGVSFIMNDFITPQRIRSTSLASVIRNDKFATFKEKNPGVAITYFKGFTPHIDFAATLGGSFVNLPLESKTFSQDNLLWEVDASAHFKMFTEQKLFNPYLIAGVGASKYTNIYGAFVPLGGGIKARVFNETQMFIQMQYRVPVTPDANNYHMQLSIGFSGLLGKGK